MNPNQLLYTPLVPKHSKSIKYITRDFDGFRDNLIKYIKTYFPDTYKDFHPASSGMMLVELNAYIGDVLSFYIDQCFKEMFLSTASQRKNIVNRAKFLGYKPRAKSPSYVNVDLYIVVPSIASASTYIADNNYTIYVKKNAQLSSTAGGITFETLDPVDFSDNTTYSPRTDTIYEYDSSDNPTKFLLKKSVPAVSGKTKSFTYTVTNPSQFLKVKIPDEDVIDIISVTDTEGNTWHEVDYLAQDTIYYDMVNDSRNSTDFYSDAIDTPYLLRSKRITKRFVKEVDYNGDTYIRFGSGLLYNSDDEVIDNPLSVPLPLSGSSYTYQAIDPSNYLKNRTLGETPYNTVLTIKYRYGGGKKSNVGVNTITTIVKSETSLATPNNSLNQSTLNTVFASLAVNNPEPAVGGTDFEQNNFIKENASAFFAAQDRVVTIPDYMARLLSMPSKYGSIAKVHVEPTSQRVLDIQSFRKIDMNKYGINLYILSYNNLGQLTLTNSALRENIKTYLSKFRMINDGINILDGKIINIKVHFKIHVLPQYNKSLVLTNCIANVAQYFNIENWSFNQPIVITDLMYNIQKTEGVQAIRSVDIENIYSGNYSNCVYDITANTYDQVIYPSSQVSIFEVKYPDRDIFGTCV